MKLVSLLFFFKTFSNGSVFFAKGDYVRFIDDDGSEVWGQIHEITYKLFDELIKGQFIIANNFENGKTTEQLSDMAVVSTFRKKKMKCNYQNNLYLFFSAPRCNWMES